MSVSISSRVSDEVRAAWSEEEVATKGEPMAAGDEDEEEEASVAGAVRACFFFFAFLVLAGAIAFAGSTPSSICVGITI